MSQPLAKTPPTYNSSVLCPCDPIPLLVVLFSIAGTGHLRKFCRRGKTHVEFACRCEWKKCLAAFTRKFGRICPEKGQILLRKRREITRKFGRHVLTDRKVWPSFEL